MLTKQNMMEMALKECVAMLGEDVVMSHKDLCCCTCGMDDDGLFVYNLGLDTSETPLSIGKETPMEFYAFVTINPKTGEVKRDYKKSVLPQ